jgi:hypothetical protein
MTAISLPRSTGLLTDGTLRPDHLSKRSPGITLCHPQFGLIPLPGCAKEDGVVITKSEGGGEEGEEGVAAAEGE